MALTPEEKKQALATKPRLSDAEKSSALSSMPKENSIGSQLAQSSLSGMATALSALFGAKGGLKDLASGGNQLVTGKPIEYAPATGLENFTSSYAPVANTLGYTGSQVAAAMIAPLGVASRAAQFGKLAKMLGQGTEGALITPFFDPDHPVKAAAEGFGAGAATRPVEFGINKLSEAGSKSLNSILRFIGSGKNPPEKIEKNIAALQTIGADKKMPLGEVINSPHLTGLQSIVASIPGSGQAGNYMDVGKAIENTTNNVVKTLEPPKTDLLGNPIDVNDLLVDKLTLTRGEAEAANKRLFDEVEKTADATSQKVNPGNYSKAVDKELKTLTRFSNENGAWDDIYDPNLIKVLTRDSNKPELSYGAAFDLDRRINDAISIAKAKNDIPTRNVLNKLKTAINNDIDRSAMQSGNDDLIQQWKDAKNHHKDVVLPLRKKQINQFIQGDKNSEDIIPTFLKGGQFEKPQLLNSFTQHLSPEEKGYVAHEFLTKGLRENLGDQELEAGKILNTYEKMGDNVKKILFSPEQRNQLDAALAAKKMAGMNLNQMVNPKTGNQWLKAASWTSAIGSLGAIPIAANVTTRTLRNPALRNLYLEAVKRKIHPSDKKLGNAYRGLLPFLRESQGGNS